MESRKYEFPASSEPGRLNLYPKIEISEIIEICEKPIIVNLKNCSDLELKISANIQVGNVSQITEKDIQNQTKESDTLSKDRVSDSFV